MQQCDMAAADPTIGKGKAVSMAMKYMEKECVVAHYHSMVPLLKLILVGITSKKAGSKQL